MVKATAGNKQVARDNEIWDDESNRVNDDGEIDVIEMMRRNGGDGGDRYNGGGGGGGGRRD